MKGTTRYKRYELGDSPFVVYDTAGRLFNVEEEKHMELVARIKDGLRADTILSPEDLTEPWLAPGDH